MRIVSDLHRVRQRQLLKSEQPNKPVAVMLVKEQRYNRIAREWTQKYAM